MPDDKKLPLPESLRYDEHGALIFAAEPGPGGDELVADLPLSPEEDHVARVRGWGRLTGTGGLRLSDEEAVAYQDRVGRFMVGAWNLAMRSVFTEEEIQAFAEVPKGNKSGEAQTKR